MPLIDVSEIFGDPDFMDSFLVARRAETMTPQGRPVTEPAYTTAYGSVQAASGSDLDMLPESQRQGKFLSIVTMFRLQGITTGMQPDIVVWPVNSGDRFKVVHTDDYSRHGSGFIQAIAQSIDSTNAAPQ